jgi:hypothetical protein
LPIPMLFGPRGAGAGGAPPFFPAPFPPVPPPVPPFPAYLFFMPPPPEGAGAAAAGEVVAPPPLSYFGGVAPIQSRYPTPGFSGSGGGGVGGGSSTRAAVQLDALALAASSRGSDGFPFGAAALPYPPVLLNPPNPLMMTRPPGAQAPPFEAGGGGADSRSRSRNHAYAV